MMPGDMSELPFELLVSERVGEAVDAQKLTIHTNRLSLLAHASLLGATLEDPPRVSLLEVGEFPGKDQKGALIVPLREKGPLHQELLVDAIIAALEELGRTQKRETLEIPGFHAATASLLGGPAVAAILQSPTPLWVASAGFVAGTGAVIWGNRAQEDLAPDFSELAPILTIAEPLPRYQAPN